MKRTLLLAVFVLAVLIMVIGLQVHSRSQKTQQPKTASTNEKASSYAGPVEAPPPAIAPEAHLTVADKAALESIVARPAENVAEPAKHSRRWRFDAPARDILGGEGFTVFSHGPDQEAPKGGIYNP